MKLYAISDLHVGHPQNREALASMPRFPDDWLVVAGDVGETLEHLDLALSALTERFARVLWVPGNHELWTTPDGRGGHLAGEAKYRAMVARCREHGVATPEDPFATWDGPGGPHVVALLFALYDYSFRPDDVPAHRALDWAAAAGLRCADEDLLSPAPYATRADWCRARVALAERALAEASARAPLVLVNHFPLKQRLALLPAIPRFSIWCGTRLTEDWHTRFSARVVISGHLHVRTTQWLDGVRFEEVSLGYPRQWRRNAALHDHLREILPGPAMPPGNEGPPHIRPHR